MLRDAARMDVEMTRACHRMLPALRLIIIIILYCARAVQPIKERKQGGLQQGVYLLHEK